MAVKVYLFPLTYEETHNNTAKHVGYLFVSAHRERLIEITDITSGDSNGGMDFTSGYDRALTYPVYNGIPLMIFKDYVDVTNKERIFVCKRLDGEHDVSEEMRGKDIFALSIPSPMSEEVNISNETTAPETEAEKKSPEGDGDGEENSPETAEAGNQEETEHQEAAE